MSQNSPITKVEVEKGFFISKAFADHWLEIVSTRMDFIDIKATLSQNISKTESSFGYYPYLPKGVDYPIDYRGELMFPLAQINFSETPALHGYPQKGILQFFTSMDDVYGIDYEEQDNQEGFCVRYYENIEGVEIVDDMSFIDPVFDIYTGNSPLYDPHKLSFSLKQEYVGLYDERYIKRSPFNVDDWVKEYPEFESILTDELLDIFTSSNHKIGGYAYFTQSDPRGYIEKFKDYILLLQIGGDENIMWGDIGVGNFFIHPNDLVKKDFSKVMYNWDC